MECVGVFVLGGVWSLIEVAQDKWVLKGRKKPRSALEGQ